MPHLIGRVAFSLRQHGGICQPGVLTQAGDGGLALERPMPSYVMPLEDLGGERLPEGMEEPRGMLRVAIAPVVSQGPLWFDLNHGFLAAFGDVTLWNIPCYFFVIPNTSTYIFP